MTSSTGDTTVFIDTNLNTHLVTIVSDSVTVSDLKRIIVSEHHQCFPAIGNIKIDGLKVKRRGNFYRMPDSMRVKGAFAANKDNWFISVDASRLEQTCGVQHVDKDKAGDRIALPWVTDNHSIDQGSPSMLPPKLVPFVNPEVSNVGQITIVDSLKGCQKYTEKDRPFNNEISSKKRTRAVQNDSLLEDASGSGPSVKKKRKTQKKEPSVKASENLGNENTIISITKLSENSSVHDQVATVVPSGVVDIAAETPLKNAEASETVAEISMILEKNIQQEVPSEVYQKDKDKGLVQKTVAGSEILSSSMRTSDCEPGTSALSHQKGAKSSTKRKAAEKEVAATSLIKTQHNINTDATDLSKKGLGSTVKESAGVETDNHEKDKEASLIQEPEVKLPVRKKKVKKPAAKNKDESLVKRADNIVSETSSIVPATTVDEKISAETKNDKGSLSNAEKNEGLEKTLMGDVIMQEAETSKPTDVMAETSKPTEVVVETLKPTEVVIETLKPTEVVVETSKKDLKDVVGSRKTKKDVGKSATITDAATVTNKEELLPHSEMKDSQDITSIDALHVDHGSKNDIVTNNDAEISKTEKTASQVNAEGVDERSEKQNEKMDDKKVKRKKRKTKKSANNGEGSMSTAVSVPPLYDEARYPKMALLHAAIEDKGSLSNAEKNQGLEKTLTGDVIMQEAETSKPTEVMVETSKPTEVVVETLKPTEVVVETSKKDLKDAVGSRKTKKDVGKSATRTDAATVTNKEELLPHSEMKDSQDITAIDALHVDHGSKNDIVTNNDAEMSKTEKTASQVNVEGVDEKSEKQNEKMDDKKVKRKKRKTKKSANNGEGSMSTAVSVPPLYDEARYPKMALLHAAIEDVDQMKGKNGHVFDEGLVKKALKSNKSSVTAPEDLPSKRQFTEPEVEPENIDHQTSKNLTVSEVSKNKDDVSNEVNISKDGSHKIDFLKSFTPGKDTTQSVKEKKPKKTKEPSLVDSRNDSAMQSQKLASKNENKKAPTDVVNGSNIPNTDQFKTPKKISKIDASRTSKLAHANKAHGKPSAESLLNQKSNKRQSTLSQSSVKNVQKSAPVKNSSYIKSLLNKPGSIFGGDSDESSTDENATANSDSSTRTPSGRSSSGDSTTSIESRRKGSHADKRKSVGKDSTNSQSKSKGMTMADLLRSSSRFKKAKVTASQQARDTESQSVDFVPETQP